MPENQIPQAPGIYATYTSREIAGWMFGGLTRMLARFYDQIEAREAPTVRVHVFRAGWPTPRQLRDDYNPETVEKTMENQHPGCRRVHWTDFASEVKRLRTGGSIVEQPKKGKKARVALK